METTACQLAAGIASGSPTMRKLNESGPLYLLTRVWQQAIIVGLMRVRKPSLGAVLLGLIPFIAMCLSVSLWDRVEPMILGLPFNLFWLIAWIVLSSLCMWAAYRVEAARGRKDSGVQ
jgi:hypothetical protein